MRAGLRRRIFRERDLFGEGADGLARGAHIDGIARLEAGRARPADSTMPLPSKPKVRGKPVFGDALEIAAHDLEVDRIEACGMKLDQHVLGTGDGIGDLGQPHVVCDRAVAVE